MRASTRLLGLETVELAPALIPMVLVAALLAIGTAARPLITSNTQDTLCWFAAIVGIGQGLLDRRHRTNAFLRHRPIENPRVQGARAIAGLLALAAIVGIFVAVRGGVRLTLGPDERESLHNFERNLGEIELGTVLWHVWAAVVARMLLLWAVLRFAVSTRGFVAPILLAPTLTAASLVATSMAVHGLPAWMPATGTAAVLAMYQGMRP